MKNFLSSNNTKLKRAGIYAWGIPAYQASDGFRTCPGAKDCVTGCYAKQGFFVMPNVKAAQEERLALSKRAEFVATIDSEIKRRKVAVLRIHDSGDFYSFAYLNSWLAIIAKNPQTKFYAYTKMIPLFQREELPPNFKVIFSYGGKYDDRIDRKRDAHSVVFDSAAALRRAGYSDAHHDDTVAIRSRKVGLIYHGAKAKAFTAGN